MAARAKPVWWRRSSTATKGSDRLGRTDDGNTVCDFEPEEIRRKASLSLALASAVYSGTKLNLIDVPGLFDFELGIHEGLPAADGAVICISARDGLEVGSKKAYRMVHDAGKPAMFYVSKIDVENADFYKVFEELKSEFGPSICPVVVPVEQAGGRIYINLIKMEAYSYVNGTPHTVPMPSFGHRLDGLVEAMSEAVAETDEELMEKFFSGEPFTQEELQRGVKAGIKAGSITPVFCGSSTKLDCIDAMLPLHETSDALPRGGCARSSARGRTASRSSCPVMRPVRWRSMSSRRSPTRLSAN